MDSEIDIRKYNPNSYKKLFSEFKWNIPTQFNIAEAICDRHTKNKNQIAIYYHENYDTVTKHTFSSIQSRANQLCNLLQELGIKKGDRIAIMLSQSPNMAISLISTYKIGGIALTISHLAGSEALKYRLVNSESKILITTSDIINKFKSVLENIKTLKFIIVDSELKENNYINFEELSNFSPNFETVKTLANDPAHLLYSSGTTGSPKGILHAHRLLLGLIPCWQLNYGLAPKEKDVFWGPAESAWLGGIGNLIYPAWYFGMAVVATSRTTIFNPESALSIIEKNKVTACYFVPTVLRMIRKKIIFPQKKYDISSLRVIVAGSEIVGTDIINWCNQYLKVPLNELYGLTESPPVLSTCSELGRIKSGSIGSPAPGHQVEILNQDGKINSSEEIGEIVIDKRTPVMFLGYWQNSEATKNKFLDKWFLTGDLGYKDKDGYFWFISRKDDMIKSSAYRIGPGEIETVLNQYPAVLESAVIGKPDKLRGSIIKAFVVLKPQYQNNENMVNDIMQFVKNRLATYAYPKEIEFIDDLPKTSNGKIKRYLLKN